ncbi:MAG: DUF4386 family protein [Saprospiraceae bacterium]|nr:DUF4386 family protein [Lewinella sp.]
MSFKVSNRKRATAVGILIVLAYSMLVYSITGNKILGFFTDVISGLAVIGIPLLLYPFFNTNGNRRLNYAYLLSRLGEGALMIVGGLFILIPSVTLYRDSIYENIHIYFFIAGALALYLLLYRTRLVPAYISVWGLIATLILLLVTVIRLFGVNSSLFDVLLLPIILNELYLAFWLIIKGFDPEATGKS